MEKRLIISLLRVYHSDKPRHAASSVLQQFVTKFNIGEHSGAGLVFSEQDKQEIRALLREEGIDASTTMPDQWQGLSRAASLELGSNEKMTDAAVRPGRVAIKALPGRGLLLPGGPFRLPDGANLDINGALLTRQSSHETVLLVENWETFDAIHAVALDLSRAGDNPLVVFRGSPAYRQDHVIALLQGLCVPVYAFVDLDPAGLVIAQSLPYFAGLLHPLEPVLEPMLARAGNHDRYRAQLPQARAALDAATHPEIIALWRLLQKHGAALPQEYFLTQNTLAGG